MQALAEEIVILPKVVIQCACVTFYCLFEHVCLCEGKHNTRFTMSIRN